MVCTFLNQNKPVHYGSYLMSHREYMTAANLGFLHQNPHHALLTVGVKWLPVFTVCLLDILDIWIGIHVTYVMFIMGILWLNSKQWSRWTLIVRRPVTARIFMDWVKIFSSSFYFILMLFDTVFSTPMSLQTLLNKPGFWWTAKFPDSMHCGLFVPGLSYQVCRWGST